MRFSLNFLSHIFTRSATRIHCNCNFSHANFPIFHTQNIRILARSFFTHFHACCFSRVVMPFVFHGFPRLSFFTHFHAFRFSRISFLRISTPIVFHAFSRLSFFTYFVFTHFHAYRFSRISTPFVFHAFPRVFHAQLPVKTSQYPGSKQLSVYLSNLLPWAVWRFTFVPEVLGAPVVEGWMPAIIPGGGPPAGPELLRLTPAGVGLGLVVVADETPTPARRDRIVFWSACGDGEWPMAGW